MENKSKVVVLMATFNGMPWLPEQVGSILNQSGIEVELVISDDCSSDNSKVWLYNLAKKDSRVILLPSTHRFFSAGKNFYRLIIDANISNCDYVAFADQDDIWLPNKLISHVEILKKNHAEGVSSNVIAFWPSGKTKVIIKSQPQKLWDYLFESAGPGCTFLMTPWLINKVRMQLVNENSPAREVVLHDWLTYAVCRSHGHKWIIDSTPSVKYRQHSNNVVGANAGLKAKWVRVLKLKHGWYHDEVVKLTQVCIAISNDAAVKKIANLLQKKDMFSQIKLIAYILQARRKFSDQLALGFSLIFFFI